MILLWYRYQEKNLPSKAELDEYIKEWHESYEDLAKRSEMVFGHMDLNDSNIIYDSKTGEFG